MYPGHIAATAPDRLAVVMSDGSGSYTYAELDRAANRVSNLLRAAGLGVGDHVALCLENHPRFFEIVWGCHYAGLVYTACSSRLTSDELSYIVNDCGARAFVTSAYKADQAAELLSTTPGVGLRLMLDGTIQGYAPYEEAVASASSEPLPDRIDGADMLYSSGTTGRPKGVSLGRPSNPLGSPQTLTLLAQFLMGMDDTTVYLSPAPLYHAAPLRWNMTVHRIGGTSVVMPNFDAEDFLALVDRHSITHVQTVPTMFVRMLKLDPSVRTRYRTGSLRCVFHAAAPCPVSVKHDMISWFGPIIHEYYAGSEGNGFVYCNSEQWLAHPGTVGTALSGVVHILDDAGNELGPNETGTIYFESPSEFTYHNDAAKTAASRDPKGRGWTTLGDIGYLDDEKFLFLTDRKAFMIITGGVNVYPQEAENILVTHPKVVDVAVFGVPDDEFGETVKAVVQPSAMPGDPERARELEAELIAHCRAHLADVKCPRSIDFREELPRHPTGKLYKRLLKDEYWAAAGRNI
ncbi:MAG: acyl-CoA synthetase [Acidobacteria bacterium]|nr:acyl-CoA synthetase [Acidobacteriota bacterium]